MSDPASAARVPAMRTLLTLALPIIGVNVGLFVPHGSVRRAVLLRLALEAPLGGRGGPASRCRGGAPPRPSLRTFCKAAFSRLATSGSTVPPSGWFSRWKTTSLGSRLVAKLSCGTRW